MAVNEQHVSWLVSTVKLHQPIDGGALVAIMRNKGLTKRQAQYAAQIADERGLIRFGDGWLISTT